MDRQKKPKTSFVIGAIALLFLIIGYETALFVHKAAVERIVSLQEKPDTVYVVVGEGEEGDALGLRPRHDKKSGARHDSGEGDFSASLEMTERKALEMTEGKGARNDRRRDTVRVRAEGRSGVAQEVMDKYAPKMEEPFRFNPNTVSVEDLQRLGFSRRQAESIDNYRRKGGVFRRREDFAKSYVVSDSVYERLAPYISIPKLDINKADSAAFTTLPGIGKYFAAKMVEYRTRLGGYSFPEQLMDIYRFDREKYDGLKDLITCSKPSPYPIWTASEAELAAHPYIGRDAARSIILYRENTPPEERSVDGIIKAGIIAEDHAGKFRGCVFATEGGSPLSLQE
ncbi:MAG: helix-hairpin-helix domain-containing protein [Bacteroidales bacterium]|nr:helix-hairpin-helix domain-containing protein [Bacteroidales bacterium]